MFNNVMYFFCSFYRFSQFLARGLWFFSGFGSWYFDQINFWVVVARGGLYDVLCLTEKLYIVF